MPADKFVLTVFTGGLFALLLCACGGTTDKINSGQVLPAAVTENNTVPNRNDLNRALRERLAITFVYGSGPLADKYRQLLQPLSLRTRSGEIVKTIVQDTELDLATHRDEILFLIGTPAHNQILRNLLPDLPWEMSEGNFDFFGENYADPSAVFKVYTYPHPHNPQLPLFLLTGNQEAAIYDWLREAFAENPGRSFWRSWGYEVYLQNKLRVFGHFDSDTWRADPEYHYDFRRAGDTLVSSSHFNFIIEGNQISREYVEGLAHACEAMVEKIASFLEMDTDGFTLNYHLYDDIEQKGVKHANNQPAHAAPDGKQLYVVVNEDFKGQYLHLENNLLLRKLMGQPKFTALEKGLAIFFTEHWQEQGYSYWAKRLLDSGNLPPLVQLMNNRFFEETSYLVNEAAAGSFIAFLVESWGKERFLEMYTNWAPAAAELNLLDAEWRKYLEGQPDVAKSRSRSSVIEFYKGFNFAHEGYQIYNGFGSRLAAESIDRMGGIGVNSLAIVPYSYMRNPNRAVRIPLVQRAGTENDPAVLYAHYAAHRAGMQTMLKPQIWLGGGSWPGDVAMQSEEDWEKFFEYYYDWILHYALLAEIHQFDIFCVGVEFAKATRQRPEQWRELVQKMRKLYSGKLTYAANWGDEFEHFSFWEEFDYIGLDCYYPLSEEQRPSKKELTKNFEEVLEKAEEISLRFQKPVIFTEIGFRSVTGTWVNPHEDARNRPFDEEAQDLCYEVVLEAIQNKEWLRGIFWWKWPSYLDHTGKNNRGFTPNGKMAERTIEKWFHKMK